MNRHRLRRAFNSYHVWLAWLTGVPLLIWTVSGLFMASLPIDTVRGTHLRAPVAPLPAVAVIAPNLDGRPAERLTLASQDNEPVWLIDYADGGKRRASGSDGRLLPPLTASEAAQLAEAAYAGEAVLASVRRLSADQAPLDLRLERPSWQARFTDGSHVYLDADTGAVLAIRSRLWRAFDFMWGLHIMDLQTREDTSHPILIVFAVLSVLASLLGLVLLPLRYMRGKPRQAETN